MKTSHASSRKKLLSITEKFPQELKDWVAFFLSQAGHEIILKATV